VKTDKPKKDWSKFVEAKKELEYVTSGQLLEQAIYELMEREGWDFENEKFIDFNDNDEDNFSKKHKHTHIEEDHDLTTGEDLENEITRNEHQATNTENTSNPLAIEVSNEIPEFPSTINAKIPSNEEIFTYAFCKLYENLPEVHYEQIEQLSLPFFKVKEDRAIKNKLNILIGNQCMVRKQSDKKWFKILPEGIQRFKTENSHLEEILEKEVNKDFWNALMP